MFTGSLLRSTYGRQTCIFCTVHQEALSFKASKSALNEQRREISRSQSHLQSNSAAPAPRENGDNDQGESHSNSAYKASRPVPGGWGQSRPRKEYGPPEQQNRQHLRDRTDQEAFRGSYNSSKPRFGQRNTEDGVPQTRNSYDGKQSTRGSLGDLSSSWRHFSRRNREDEASSDFGGRGAQTQRTFEEQRRRREENARSGKYTGFGNKPSDRGEAHQGRGEPWRLGGRPPSSAKDWGRSGPGDYTPRRQRTDRRDDHFRSRTSESTDRRYGAEPVASLDAASVQIPNPDQEQPRGRFDQETAQERKRRREEKFLRETSASKPNFDDRRSKAGGKSRRNEKFVSEDEEETAEQAAAKAEQKRQRKKDKAIQKAHAAPTPIAIPEFISVENLARLVKVKLDRFSNKLRELGFEETNHDFILNAENAALIAAEYNFEPILEKDEDADLLARPLAQDKSALPQRPPVITIMGHVDHGKTTLLDWLRKSSVAATEHGGITQHIGAFSVPMPSGKIITFLDTPGHEAFLSMRQRGANVTDLVILVVAADDSVKPQTLEAIKHANAAKVPMIVAINKVDKPDANIQQVKQDLARHGLELEDFGGDTQCIPVSGKTGQGMQDLEEAAVALSEIIDARAEHDGPVEGWILEATTKKSGRVATVLVRRGTLRLGDTIVAGRSWARIRSLRNEAGVDVAQAAPGTPVEVDGWREQPSAGDEVLQAENEGQAKAVVDHRVNKAERLKLAADMEAVNENRRLEQERREQEKREAEEAEKRKKAGDSAELQPPGQAEAEATASEENAGVKEISFIIKADVSGSVEAVVNSVAALGNAEVRANILRSSVGAISEFDVDHAASAQGHLISFNTRLDPSMSRKAEAAGVEVINESIIYRLVDEVKAKLSAHLKPSVTQRVQGEAEVAQIFDITVKGRTKRPVAGCKVRNGTLTRNSRVRVVRGVDKNVAYDGILSSLRIVKKDVSEVRKGNDCGISFDNDWTEFEVGDQIQAYDEVVEARTL